MGPREGRRPLSSCSWSLPPTRSVPPRPDITRGLTPAQCLSLCSAAISVTGSAEGRAEEEARRRVRPWHGGACSSL